MKELSLHILDIAENSVKAGADLIEIGIFENDAENSLKIKIKDNGCGMSEEFLKHVKDPFSTTRTTRRVGMGLSLFEAAAEQCGGGLEISSKEGVGTEVFVTFTLNHIDRAPLGDIAATMQTLIGGSPNIDFVFRYEKNGKIFLVSTAEMRETLGDVPLDTPEVILWLSDYIKEGINELE